MPVNGERRGSALVGRGTSRSSVRHRRVLSVVGRNPSTARLVSETSVIAMPLMKPLDSLSSC